MNLLFQAVTQAETHMQSAQKCLGEAGSDGELTLSPEQVAKLNTDLREALRWTSAVRDHLSPQV